MNVFVLYLICSCFLVIIFAILLIFKNMFSKLLNCNKELIDRVMSVNQTYDYYYNTKQKLEKVDEKLREKGLVDEKETKIIDTLLERFEKEENLL